MPCGACGQTRRAAITAASRFDVRGFTQAVTRGVAINIDKLKGIDVDKKYPQPVIPPTTSVNRATPYRRPERLR